LPSDVAVMRLTCSRAPSRCWRSATVPHRATGHPYGGHRSGARVQAAVGWVGRAASVGASPLPRRGRPRDGQRGAVGTEQEAGAMQTLSIIEADWTAPQSCMTCCCSSAPRPAT
jgi:hypothetical protein